MRKILTIVTIIALAAVLLSACTQPTPEPPAPEPTAVPPEPTPEGPEPITITWWSERATGAHNQYMRLPEYESGELGNILVDLWHEEHPEYAHVTVEVIVASYGGGTIDPQLDAMIAANNAPDVIDGYAGRFASYLPMAVELRLTQEEIDDLFYYEPGLSVVRSPGTVEYGLVNATVLGSVGIEPPEPWTWIPYKTLLDWGKELRKNDLYLGCVWCAAPSSMQMIWAWFGNAGLQIWEEDYAGIALNTKEGADIMKELVQLNEQGYFVPGAPGMVDDDCIFSYWTQNKLAYFQGGRLAFMPWFDGAIEAGIIPEVPDIVPVMGVTFSGEEGLLEAQVLTNIGFVTDSCPEEAIEAASSLINYVTSCWYWDGYPSALPHSKTQAAVSGLPEEAYVIQYALDNMMDAGTASPFYNDARGIFGEELGAAIRGEVKPAEALENFEARVEALMAE